MQNPDVEKSARSNSKVFGYARVSTPDQDPMLQIKALTNYGISQENIWVESMSGSRMDRPVLMKVYRALREGDTLVVWKLDRLGRSVRGVLDAVARFKDEGIDLKSLTEPFDTTTPMGQMMMTLLIALAEMERNLISERTRAGMKVRMEAGQKFGRAHTIIDNPLRLARMQELFDQDKLTGMSHRDVLAELNAADPKSKKITSVETVRKWRRRGGAGLVLNEEL